MGAEIYYLVAGGILLLMAISGTLVKRLPLTPGLIYLLLGVVVGPQVANVLPVNLALHPRLVEHVAEIAVLLSLFTAGLKLRVALRARRWQSPLRLAVPAMLLTVAGTAAVAYLLLDFPWPLAVLMGAIVAPTDPVLASEVQVDDPGDRDAVRFALTGEAGLNDGTAFPCVLLGLGLLGLHDVGPLGVRWLTLDVLWASAAGLGVGAALGHAVARLVVYLRRHHKEAVGLDDYLALGLVASSYGIAILIQAYGFLAVFAAGLALRQIEQASAPGVPARADGPNPAAPASSAHTSQEMAAAVLSFNEQIERMAEVVVVVLLGALLTPQMFSVTTAGVALVVFLAVRPLAVYATTSGLGLAAAQRRLIAWFGVRGAGSVYYLAFAATHGVSAPEMATLGNAVLPVVALSICIHGVSVTPLMTRYRMRQRRPTISRATR